jgi:two-component system chemotaxis response regulator CheB
VKEMIQVLIVDDSPVARELLEFILSQDPEISIIGTAQDGEEAVRLTLEKKPDIITMDINMPTMNGFDATRIIMETTPVPIIIVTASENLRDVATSFRALEAGAITLMPRPPGVNHPEFEAMAQQMVDSVKTYSEVKVVRRYPRRGNLSVPHPILKAKMKIEPLKERARVVAIGTSTGGPVVIQAILAGLNPEFPLPVLIVQHMTRGFGEGFVKWLMETTGFPIQIATNGEPLRSGHAYIARDGFQMGVTVDDRILLVDAPLENWVRPSVSFLFRSIRQVYGDRAIAVLLTGMGADGAVELKQLKDAGAVTIAQDEQSSVIYGMPGEAVRLGGATYVLSPEKIVDVLIEIADNRRNNRVSRE